MAQPAAARSRGAQRAISTSSGARRAQRRARARRGGVAGDEIRCTRTPDEERATRGGCASCSRSTTTSSRFTARYRSDALIGRVLHANPKLRVMRTPDPFEALAWAVIDQLIDTQKAGNIAWTLTRRHGTRHDTAPYVAPAAERSSPTRPRSRPAGLAATQARTLARVSRRAQGVNPRPRPPRIDRLAGIGEWTLAPYGPGSDSAAMTSHSRATSASATAAPAHRGRRAPGASPSRSSPPCSTATRRGRAWPRSTSSRRDGVVVVVVTIQ